jgi:hypothetical protein
VANQEVLLTLTAHGDAVVDAEFSLDGTLLAAAGRDGIIPHLHVDIPFGERRPGDFSCEPGNIKDRFRLQ